MTDCITLMIKVLFPLTAEETLLKDAQDFPRNTVIRGGGTPVSFPPLLQAPPHSTMLFVLKQVQFPLPLRLQDCALWSWTCQHHQEPESCLHPEGGWMLLHTSSMPQAKPGLTSVSPAWWEKRTSGERQSARWCLLDFVPTAWSQTASMLRRDYSGGSTRRHRLSWAPAP